MVCRVVWACSLLVVAHALRDNEQYLSSVSDELLNFRKDPVAKRYKLLTDIVNVIPRQVENLFLHVLFRGTEVTLPLNITTAIHIPIEGGSIDMNWAFEEATLGGLAGSKTLQPLKLLKDGDYTWAGKINLRDLHLRLSRAELLDWNLKAEVEANLVNPSIEFEAVIALNQSKLGGHHWVKQMRKSANCAAWPVANNEELGLSGLNITALKLNVDDLDFNINITGGTFGQDWNDEFATNLEGAFMDQKPSILANLSTAYSSQAQSTANGLALHEVAAMHRDQPCQQTSVIV